ncbi:TetR family transcriptional regulator [Catenovulum agarivorans DS-2]|uniref:TetR family transcriptional regulator n=2 Tax=Catenovulum agarivorans TaxID=1172192 RepID=W7QQN4_9ALTE|nr:TetR family transcriptional regulator [Catenovulum agarivorans DS-2]
MSDMKLSDKKRLQIIEAAVDLFSNSGVDATSMDMVAKVAQVSKRTVYNHFATKELLFSAVLNHMLADIECNERLKFEPTIAIDEQLLQIAQAEVNLLTSDAFLRIARMTFIQLLHDAKLAQTLNQQHIGCLGTLPNFLAQACEHGLLSIEDLELAAKQFVYQLKSLIFYPLLYGIETPNQQRYDYLIEQTVELFLARYAAKIA